MSADEAILIKPVTLTSGGSYTRAFGATGNQYFDSSGNFVSVATNDSTPRWNYDPVTLKPLGLMVEGASSNAVPTPQFTSDGVGYAFPFGGITDAGVDAAVTAVDHTAGSRKITVTADNSILRICATTTNEGLGLTDGTATNYYSGSVWIKSSSAGAQVSALASVNQDTAVPITITDTWQRVKATGVNLFQTYRFFELRLPVGDYYIWGGQVENGRVVTSFMTRARLAETCTAQVMSLTPTPATGVYADPPSWLNSNAYSTGDRVHVLAQLSIYERINAATPTVDAASPETDSTKWTRVGPMNVWRAFDDSVQSQAEESDYLVYSLAPGVLHDALVLLNLEGIRVRVIIGDSDYDQSQDLTNRVVGNWFEYYFSEFEYRTDVVFRDLPIRINNRITVIVENPGGRAAVGAIIVGRSKPIGQCLMGAEASINDFSVKTQDPFGNFKITQRPSSKRNNYAILVPKYRMNPVYRMLDAYRATPAVYIGIGNDYEPWILWGFFRNFTLVVQYQEYLLCNLEAESLT